MEVSYGYDGVRGEGREVEGEGGFERVGVRVV